MQIDSDYFSRAHYHWAQERGLVCMETVGTMQHFAWSLGDAFDFDNDLLRVQAHFCESLVTALNAESLDTSWRALLQAKEYAGRLAGLEGRTSTFPCGSTSLDALRAAETDVWRRTEL